MLSYWERASFFTGIDVCIIGAGIVGLHTALFLKEKYPNYSIAVFERGTLPFGASTRNAGFACFGSPSELLADLTKFPATDVFSLVEKRWNGLQDLIKTHGEFNLGLERFGGYEVFAPDDNASYSNCQNQLGFLNHELKSITGTANVFTNRTEQIQALGLGKVAHLIYNELEAQIDTGKLMKHLLQQVQAAGVQLYFGLEITALHATNQGTVQLYSNGFNFEVKQVAITTNGFIQQLLPELEIKPARAQVLITQPIPQLKLKGTFHYDEGYYYFRNVDDRVLFGGGRNLAFEAETTTDMQVTNPIQNKLDELLATMILPGVNYEVDMRWSGIMGMGDEKLPIIKETSIPSVYVAARCNGMGVAMGIQIGRDLADLISKTTTN